MKILVTGHSGRVGRWVFEALAGAGHDLRGFDVAQAPADDLLDIAAVTTATRGCDAVVHLAAIPHDDAGTPEQIMAVNVLGTWHLLRAAEAAGAARVVHFSSSQVFGLAQGERLPDAFPIDDGHPRRATRPYGLSKRLTEDLCEAFTARTGSPSVSLRPVAVWAPDAYDQIAERRRREPRSEWEPYWEYGAFVDVRDVAEAVALALTTPLTGHHRLTLCAGSAPTLELAARLAPSVPITDPARYERDPRAALFDCATARATLGWRPRYGADGRCA